MSTAASVTPMNLRSVRSTDPAVDLLRQLGYSARALPYDDVRDQLGLDGTAVHLRSARSPDEGYGIVVAEVSEPLGPARGRGRRLLQAADCVVNDDLHFNPQVAVQRAGRVDRLHSQHGKVLLASFVPPEPLERRLSCNV